MLRSLPTLDEAERICMKLDRLIAQIDAKVLEVVTAVLHSPEYQRLEARWRGLHYLCHAIVVSHDIEVRLLSLTRSELMDDCLDSAVIDQCGLYQHLYSAEYDMFGGIPYSAVLVDFEFDWSIANLRLFDYISRIGMMVHAPIVTSVGAKFFNLKDWSQLSGLMDMDSVFEMAEYRKWRAFQLRENARYLVLMLNRFLIRKPYRGSKLRFYESDGQDRTQPDSRRLLAELTYDEDRWDTTGRGYLFVSPVYALGVLMVRSFMRTGWCVEIFGATDHGMLENIEAVPFDFGIGAGNRITTEFLLTNRIERQFAEEGFLPLVHHRSTEKPCVLSSRTAQAKSEKLRGTVASGSWTITSRLPFLLLVSRLAHYMKVHQRENLGSFKEAFQLERELQAWLREELITADASPSPSLRARFPLRAGSIKVVEVPGEPGRVRVEFIAQPHYQLETIDVSLSCTTTLTYGGSQGMAGRQME